MKKNLLALAAMAGLFFASSCTEELAVNQTAGETLVSFNVGVENGISSRAISDGTTATTLYYQAFEGETPVGTIEEATFSNLQTTANLSLVKGKTYNVVFWAQSDDCEAYDRSQFPKISISYEGALNNDETRDAFFACEEITVEGEDSKTVTLTRPFAQVNVGIVPEGAPAITSSRMVVTSGAYTSLDLISGEVSDPAGAVTFEYAAVPEDELTVKVEEEDTEYTYLSMSYILVDESDLTNLEFSFKNNETEVLTLSKESVPVKRNYRTNILGSYKPEDKVNIEFTVNIDKNYEADNENEDGEFTAPGEGGDDDDNGDTPEEPQVEISNVSVQDGETDVTFTATYTGIEDGEISKAEFIFTPEATTLSRAAEGEIRVEARWTEGTLTATVEKAKLEELGFIAETKYTITVSINGEDYTPEATDTEAPSFTAPEATQPEPEQPEEPTPAEPTEIVLEFSDHSGWPNSNSYSGTWSIEYNNYTWEFTNFNNNNWGWTYVKAGNASKAESGTAAIEIKEEINAKITKVTLDTKISYGTANVTLTVTKGDQQVATQTIALTTSETNILTVDTPTEGCTYKLDFDWARTSSSNGVIQVNKITLTND